MTKTRMRKRAREFPTITTAENSIFRDYFLNKIGGGYHHTGTKSHGIPGKDEIVFVKCKDCPEEEIIRLLNHEIEHWVHDLYLADDEVNKRIEAYQTEINYGRTPFTEWISNGEAYDMNEWKKKYTRQ